MKHLPTVVGLFVAIAGPAFLASPLSRFLGDPNDLQTKLIGQGCLWILFLAILCVVRIWENMPLSSIGFGSLNRQSIFWALLLTVAYVSLSMLWLPLMPKLGLGSFDPGIAKLSELPIPYLVLAVVTAGFVEETLYRGYGIERMSLFVGNRWVSGLFMMVLAALAHWPLWGFGPAVALIVMGIPGTIFFVLKRQLWPCILSHILTDAIGIILMPRMLNLVAT
jgi:membrane protease YdiL (CAAX protease family)